MYQNGIVFAKSNQIVAFAPEDVHSRTGAVLSRSVASFFFFLLQVRLQTLLVTKWERKDTKRTLTETEIEMQQCC